MTTPLRHPRIGYLFLILASWLCSAAISTAQGPIAYYPFNGNAADASGNGHDGTVNGATLTADRFGNAGSAYSFDGNDYIEVPHSPQLVFGRTQSFTISAWIRMCELQRDFAGIVVKGPTNTYRPGYQFVIRSGNRASSVVSNNDGNWTGVIGATRLDTCCWHFITLVVSPPASALKVYVDGKLDDSASSSIIEPDYLDQQNPLFIGKERNSSVFFKGDIDDIRIFSRVLSVREIDSLFRLGNWTGGGGPPKVTHIHLCDGEPLRLDAVDFQAPYQWSTGATSQGITINRSGTYWVRGTPLSGCPRTDTFHVRFTSPPAPTSKSLLVCNGFPAVLGSSDLTAPYLWSTGATSQSIEVGTSGTYWVTGIFDGGCPRTDTFHVRAGTSPAPTVTEITACTGVPTLLEARNIQPPYLWSTGATARSIQVNESGTYWVRGYLAGQICPRTDSFKVTFETPSPIDAGSKQTICRGDTVQLSATGAGGYRWNPHPSLSCTDCANPRAFPTVTTSYIVTSTDAVGCPGRDTIQVIVYSATQPDAGPDRTICRGDSVELQVAGDEGAYRWNDDPSLGCLDCRTVRVAPSATTRYIVTITTPKGCRASDTVNVKVVDLPRAVASRDTSICIGGATRLGASGGVRYQWSPSDDLSCDNCSDPVAAPHQSRRYTVTVWNEAGCSHSDEVDVEVLPPPNVKASPDTVICRGAELQLGVEGAGSYRWSPHPDLSCLDCSNPVVRPSSRTTYYVTGSTAAGCDGIDSVTVDLREAPSLVLTGDSTICSQAQARVSVSGAETYRWWSSEGTVPCPSCSDQTITPAMSTVLYVEGRGAGGCITVDSFQVRVNDAPELSIDGAGEICPGESVTLHARGAMVYRWEPVDGLSCTNCSDPVAAPSVTTLYRMIGTDERGCIDTATAIVAIRAPVTTIARLPLETRLAIGESSSIAVTLDQDIIADTLAFDIRWRRGVLGLRDVEPSAQLKDDGWRQEQIVREDDHYRSLFVHTGKSVIAAGDLVDLTLIGFVGDSTHSALPMTLTANTTCAIIESRPGSVTIDSICGLQLRLITMGNGKLRLDPPAPHPVVGSGVIRYSVPFDAEDVDLTLVDPTGNERHLRRGYHSEGEYEATLGNDEIASGVYVLRLRVGELIRQIQVVIIR